MKRRTNLVLISIFSLIVLCTLLLYHDIYQELYNNRLGFGEPVRFADAPFEEALTPDVVQVTYVRELPRAKVLWDWLELLIVPAALATVGLLFSRAQRHHEIELARKREAADERAIESRAQEAALQGYFDRMTELLLDRRLCDPTVSDEVREIARVRTLNILRRLDTKRMRFVLEFLHDMQLICEETPTLSLQGADLRSALLRNSQLPDINLAQALLSEATLAGANLTAGQLNGALLNKADLSSAKLQDASLMGANLVKVNLRHADLRGANLVKANCAEADLSYVNLRGANLQEAHLEQVNLTGATFDEKTQWPTGFAPPPKAKVSPKRAKANQPWHWLSHSWWPSKNRMNHP